MDEAPVPTPINDNNQINYSNFIKMPKIEDNEQKKDIILDTKEYKIKKDDKIYNISVNRTDEELLIKYLNYECRLSITDLTKLTKIFIDNLNEGFKFITNIFENDKVNIKEIVKNKNMKLKITIFDYSGKEMIIEIDLIFNKKNKDFIIDELTNKCESLENEVFKLKEEIKEIKKELNELKNYIKEKNILVEKDNKIVNKGNINLNNNKFENKKVKLIGDLSKNSFAEFGLDNVFAVFNSVEKIPFLIYTTKEYSLIFFNLNEMIITKEIRKAHDDYISNINHFFDKESNKDIIMSVSYKNNNIKLWELNTYSQISNIKKINSHSLLLSACFLRNEDEKYIVTSNGDINTKIKKFDPIKLYDFNGNKKKEINNSNFNTNFITTYYDKKTFDYYIISGNDGFINSYNLNQNSLHFTFQEEQNFFSHRSAAVICTEKITKLIDSREDGFILIWNFYTNELINKITTGFNALRGICIWNDDYIFIGNKDKTIKLVDINKDVIIKSIKGHNNTVLSIKKLNCVKFGNCLISHGMSDDPIKLWSVNF